MNNIDDMWPICHDCPYWEICEPPYICEVTMEKQNKTADETDLNNTVTYWTRGDVMYWIYILEMIILAIWACILHR